MYQSDNEQSKEEFYSYESNNNKNNTINDSMSRYTCVRYMLFKSHTINFLLT